MNFQTQPVILIFDNLIKVSRIIDLATGDFTLGRVQEEMPSLTYNPEAYEKLLENKILFVVEHTDNIDADNLYECLDRTTDKWYRPKYWENDVEDIYDVVMLERVIVNGKPKARRSYPRLTVPAVLAMLKDSKYRLSQIGGQKPLTKSQAKRLGVVKIDSPINLYQPIPKEPKGKVKTEAVAIPSINPKPSKAIAPQTKVKSKIKSRIRAK